MGRAVKIRRRGVRTSHYQATAGFRSAYGQDVFLFNPTDRLRKTARYNPLSYIDRNDPDDVIIELQKIATMLFVAPDHGEAFWATGARTGFTGVGVYLAESTDGPFTLGEIYRRMTQSDVRTVFKRELAKPSLNLSVGCRTALSDFAGGSDNSFADIKKTITNVLGLWLNPVVDAATSVSDFDLRDLRKRRMSVYLGVSPDKLDRIAPLHNLLFQQLIDLNVRDLPDKTTAVPVLVILDEFARLGRASVIRTNSRKMRHRCLAHCLKNHTDPGEGGGRHRATKRPGVIRRTLGLERSGRPGACRVAPERGGPSRKRRPSPSSGIGHRNAGAPRRPQTDNAPVETSATSG